MVVPHLPCIGIEKITRAERETEEVKFIDGGIKMIQGVILWREERPWRPIHFGVCQPVIMNIMRRTGDDRQKPGIPPQDGSQRTTHQRGCFCLALHKVDTSGTLDGAFGRGGDVVFRCQAQFLLPAGLGPLGDGLGRILTQVAVSQVFHPVADHWSAVGIQYGNPIRLWNSGKTQKISKFSSQLFLCCPG